MIPYIGGQVFRRGRTSFLPMLALAVSAANYAAPASAFDEDDVAAADADDAITVTARRAADLAKQAIRELPGAGAVIDSTDANRGRNANLEDLLAFQPGVFAQAGDGTGAVKISIRGSGIQTSPGYFREGIKFLYDGLPITGPGGTPDEMLNGTAVNLTEVLYGANAFKYSAVTLGGAINYTTFNGNTAPGVLGSVSLGSFNTRRYFGSIGGTAGNADFYIAAGRDLRDGYRKGTYNGLPITNFGQGFDLVGNFGYKFSSHFDVRLTARFREESYVNGSTMTLAQLRADPTQLPVVSGRRKKGTYLIGLTTGYTFDDDSRLEVGFSDNHYPHINAWRYSALPAYWTWTDLTGTVRYTRTDTLFGLKSNTNFSFNGTFNQLGQTKTYNKGTTNLYNYVKYNGSHDVVGSIGNDLQLVDGPHETWLTTGLTWVNIRRDVRVLYSSPANLASTAYSEDTPPFNRTAVDRTDTAWAPRVGLRYQLTPAFQLVGNVSRSIDPSSSWGLAGSSATYVRDLKLQKAWTAEAGVRLKTGPLEGSLTFYHAWLRNELLTLVLSQATAETDAVTAKINADKTAHQGVEAGLTARLWRNEQGDNVTLRQSYTYSDFSFKGDQTFGDNALPGLPKHSYQAELQYQDSTGFYVGVNTRVASSYYVDYANSLKVPSYGIIGARFGYEAPNNRYKIFVDAKNLANKKYVSATSPTYNAAGKDSNYFYPGDGFSVYGGVSVHF